MPPIKEIYNKILAIRDSNQKFLVENLKKTSIKELTHSNRIHLRNLIYVDLLLNTPKYIIQKTRKNYYQCLSNIAIINTLQQNNKAKEAVLKAEETIKTSIDFGFHRVTKTLSSFLLQYHYWENNAESYFYYRKSFLKSHLLVKTANKIDKIYLETIKSQHYNGTPKDDIYTSLKDLIIPIYDSEIPLRQISKLCILKISLLQYHNKHELCITSIHEHIDIIYSDKKNHYVNQLVVILTLLFDTCFSLNDFTHWQFQVDRLKKSFEYVPNRIQVDLIIKEISSKNYNNAINYFIDLGNEPIKVTSKRGITFWNITRIAISIISSIKKLEKEETPRVLRLISDIKISSDGNVDFKKTIRILEIAHFISKNKYYMAEHKIKSLNLFIKRNSKNKTYRINKRDIIFSKMLTTIPKADFNRLQLQKSIDLPSKSKIFYSSKFCLELFTPEIIPYEHLWELILETLPNKPYYA